MTIVNSSELANLSSDFTNSHNDKKRDALEEEYSAYLKAIYEEMKTKAKAGERKWTTKFLTYKMSYAISEYFRLSNFKVNLYFPDSRDEEEKDYTLVVEW
jgi:hypothetical protein